MRHLIRDTERTVLVGSALAFAAVTGWGSFAYMALSSSKEIHHLIAERDAVLVNQQQLVEATGELQHVESRLGSMRSEYTRVVQAWSDARERLGAAQQELAQLTKRLDQAKDRVNQTGSIKPAEPPRRPAR